jgi:ubiquinone/menaquinone biosynthesis C-methylase UbiE
MRDTLRSYPFLPPLAFACAAFLAIIAAVTHAAPFITAAAIALCSATAFLWGYATHLLREWPRLHNFQRSQYAEVWDSLSLTADGAADAAAGIIDEAELRRTGAEIADRIATRLGLTANDDVLEIGSGVGRIGLEIAPRCRTWTAADRSQNMLSHAQARLSGVPNAKFVHLKDGGLREIADASLDVVYCTNVLPHLDAIERWRYVREAHRVLRPGGQLYIDTVLLDSPDGWTMMDNNLRQRQNGMEPPYAPTPSPAEELQAYYRRAGFASIQVERLGSLLIVTAQRN